MDFANEAWVIFNQSIDDYHRHDDMDYVMVNPYHENELIKHLLYKKAWIDCVQWHLEDVIRDPEIDPAEALTIKRRIDKSNQDRTDMVEYIDSWFLQKYKDVVPMAGAKVNTESPAWAVDRLSILALKVFHMREQVNRTDTSEKHIAESEIKLNTLKEQKIDLANSINELLDDIASGRKYMKVYKQMKMYNDETLNPILYKNK